MLFPSQFNITKMYLELEHDALEREFSDVLNSKEYLLEAELLTVISTIVGLKP